MNVWQALTHRRPHPPSGDASSRRDPDLDRARHEQHDLINKVTSEALRESLRRRRVDMQTRSWQRHD